MTDVPPATAPTRLTARALIVGERIDTAGLERPDMISSLPLAFRVGERRHGGAVPLRRRGDGRPDPARGRGPAGETAIARQRRQGAWRRRDGGARDRARQRRAEVSGGPIQIKNLSPPRFLVVADALAKTVALARDEREVNAVFDVIEPFAAKLAATGRPPFRRRAMLQADRPGAARPAPRLGPGRGRGEAGRAVGPSRARAPLRAPRG